MTTQEEDEARGYTVVQTNVDDEEMASAAIEAIGYEPILFRYRKLIRGHHKAGWRIGDFEWRPLIRGYLFVLVPFGDEAWSLDAAAGVRQVFRRRRPDGRRGAPRYVRAREIAGIKAAVDAGTYDEIQGTGKRTDIKEGDIVRTPTGIAGSLLNLDDKGRADLMAMMMGTERLIRNVEARTLQLVSP